MKFDYGDKVVVIKNSKFEFTNAKIGEVGIIEDFFESPDCIYVKMEQGEDRFERFFEDELKIVKERCFEELIQEIKIGDSYENEEMIITKTEDGILLEMKEDPDTVIFVGNYEEFTPCKKKYNFKDAFIAYESGNIVVSLFGNDCTSKYKKEDGKDYVFDYNLNEWIINEEGFSIEEIRGQWHIE